MTPIAYVNFSCHLFLYLEHLLEKLYSYSKELKINFFNSIMEEEAGGEDEGGNEIVCKK